MKQFKHFVLALLSVVMVLSISLTTACTTTPPEPEATETLTAVSVNTDNVKTVYYLGSAYSSQGLVVTATVQKPDEAEPETRDVTSSAVIDSSAYVSTQTGEYTITVSYTLGDVTKSDSYTVIVTDKDGLNVTLASGVEDTITLSASNPNATIDTTKIVVRKVSYTGDVILTDDGVLSSSEYTVKVARNGEFIEAPYTNLGDGTYQIWAVAQSTLVSGYELKGFVVIYVVDEITKLEKTAGETEQILGNDTLSAGWTYTATYASGKTVNLTSKDVTNDIDTKTEGENKTATVTYSYKNSKGEAKNITTTVSYTIKPKPVQQGDVTYNMSYQVKTTDASAKTGSWETKWKNDTEDFDKNVTASTTTSAYLTKEKSTEDNSVTYADYAEVKGQSEKSITITVGAKATNVSITVYFSHTSKASRALYIANATTVGTDNANVLDSKAIGTADASPSTLYTLNATGLSAGNYYIYSDNGVTVHVYAVVVEYTIATSSSNETSISIDFSDTAKINANAQLASSSATGLVAIQDTGFSVTKCGTDNKYTLIGTQNSVQCLQFQGTGTTEKNSIAVTVGAGEVTVEMRYFQGSVDRYLKVLNANLDTAAATKDELTTADKSIKTRTVTFTLTEETVIYIGSASSGLYVAGITITVVGK